jgi:hypothetical protein
LALLYQYATSSLPYCSSFVTLTNKGEIINLISAKDVERMRPYPIDGLNETVLEFIGENPGCRRRDIINAVGLSFSQAQYRLFQLAIHGYLDVDTSERKKTRYYLSERD